MSTKQMLLCGIVGLAVLSSDSLLWADFGDKFLYLPGGSPLAGQGPWLPTGITTSRIRVNGAPAEGINIWSDNNHSTSPDTAFVNVSESDQVHFTVDVKGVQPTTAAYDWWELNLISDTSTTIGKWTGKSNQFTAWGWTSSFPRPFVDLIFQYPLEADIDFSKGTIDYSYNHTLIGSDTFSGGGSSIAKIEFVSRNFIGETMPAEHVYFNLLNITNTPEPGTISLLLAGAATLLAYAWRQRRHRK
jgi:hypothetical protein